MTHIKEQEKKRKFEQFFILTFPKVKAFAWKILHSEEDEKILPRIYSSNCGIIQRFGRIKRHGIAIFIQWLVIRFITS